MGVSEVVLSQKRPFVLNFFMLILKNFLTILRGCGIMGARRDQVRQKMTRGSKYVLTNLKRCGKMGAKRPYNQKL